MPFGLHSIWVRSAMAAFAGLAAGACSSSRPAPIIYAGAANIPPVHAPAPRDTGPPIAIPFNPEVEPDPANPPVILADAPESECVPFARKVSGVQIWGDAVTWWGQAEGRYVRSAHPAEGSVFVMRGYNDERRGHVAVVSAIVTDRVIRVDHANWLSQGETSLNVPVIDVSENNDWSEIRVWHIPGHHWGGRVYRTQGFIHPYRLDGGAGLISE